MKSSIILFSLLGALSGMYGMLGAQTPVICPEKTAAQVKNLIEKIPDTIYNYINTQKIATFEDPQLIKQTVADRQKWLTRFEPNVKVWNEFLSCSNKLAPSSIPKTVDKAFYTTALNKLNGANIFLNNLLKQLNAVNNNPLFDASNKYKPTASQFLQVSINNITGTGKNVSPTSQLGTLYDIYNHSLLDLTTTIPTARFITFKEPVTAAQATTFLKQQVIKTEKDAMTTFDKLDELIAKLTQRNAELDVLIKKSWTGNQPRKDEIAANQKFIDDAKKQMLNILNAYPLSTPSSFIAKLNKVTKDNAGLMVIFAQAASLASVLQSVKKQLESELKKVTGS